MEDDGHRDIAGASPVNEDVSVGANSEHEDLLTGVELWAKYVEGDDITLGGTRKRAIYQVLDSDDEEEAVKTNTDDDYRIALELHHSMNGAGHGDTTSDNINADYELSVALNQQRELAHPSTRHPEQTSLFRWFKT